MKTWLWITTLTLATAVSVFWPERVVKTAETLAYAGVVVLALYWGWNLIQRWLQTPPQPRTTPTFWGRTFGAVSDSLDNINRSQAIGPAAKAYLVVGFILPLIIGLASLGSAINLGLARVACLIDSKPGECMALFRENHPEQIKAKQGPPPQPQPAPQPSQPVPGSAPQSEPPASGSKEPPKERPEEHRGGPSFFNLTWVNNNSHLYSRNNIRPGGRAEVLIQAGQIFGYELQGEVGQHELSIRIKKDGELPMTWGDFRRRIEKNDLTLLHEIAVFEHTGKGGVITIFTKPDRNQKRK